MSITPAMSETDKFMDKFDPENSNREIRKKMRQKKSNGAGSMFGEKKLHDEKGYLASNNVDLCDCLETDCPGCHFPCLKCRSAKCGIECRVNRKWVYELMEFEGTTKSVQHPYVKSLEALIKSYSGDKQQQQQQQQPTADPS